MHCLYLHYIQYLLVVILNDLIQNNCTCIRVQVGYENMYLRKEGNLLEQ